LVAEASTLSYALARAFAAIANFMVRSSSSIDPSRIVRLRGVFAGGSVDRLHRIV
jgi:hypothetical protein